MAKKNNSKGYLVYWSDGNGDLKDISMDQGDIIGVFDSLKKIESYFLEEIFTGQVDEDHIDHYIIYELGKRVTCTYSKTEKIDFTK